MKVREFIEKLTNHKGKALLFEYAQNQFAGFNYHLTEIKNVQFETVDCGGNINNWKETHLQLWESPNELDKTEYMTVDKVISIINRVDAIKPLWLDTDIKIEFGNDSFHTSILNIANFQLKSDQLIVKLFTEKTGCKAPDICDVEMKKKTSDNIDSCCGTITTCC